MSIVSGIVFPALKYLFLFLIVYSIFPIVKLPISKGALWGIFSVLLLTWSLMKAYACSGAGNPVLKVMKVIIFFILMAIPGLDIIVLLLDLEKLHCYFFEKID